MLFNQVEQEGQEQAETSSSANQVSFLVFSFLKHVLKDPRVLQEQCQNLK